MTRSARACDPSVGAQEQEKDQGQDRGRFAGTYRCVRLEMDQKSAPCQSPPLTLNQDGSYQIWGERGTYQVMNGQWLVLSHSKRRGVGHMANPHEIIFEYRVDGRLCRVTFRQLFEAVPGVSLG